MQENKLACVGFMIIGGLILVSFAAPYITTYTPTEINILKRLQAPGTEHLMGTDEFGRDIYSRVVYGTRISLLVAFLVTGVSGVIGTFLGLISGYFGKTLDFIIMRFMDGLLAFPALLLSLAIMAALGPSLINLVVALALVYIPSFGRLSRNTVLSIRELEYVESSRASGAGSFRIIFDHVFPNCLSPLIVNATVVFGYAILSEAALSFLGFGVPSKASWGAILSDGRDFIFSSPWISIYPGLAITIFVLGSNLAGDGLRDILDPRMK